MKLGLMTGYWGSGPPAGVQEQVALAERRPGDARAYASQALRLLEGEDVDDSIKPRVQFALARALWESGGDPARAREFARERAEYLLYT